MAEQELRKRPYGTDGVEISLVGFGGIVVMNAEPADAAEAVSWAVEQGVNYFDVAPSYGDAELKLGPALAPYRSDVFLACKTGERLREGAAAQLATSLEHLQTDYLDLYQLHGLTAPDKDVDVAFGPGGALEVLDEAKRAGVVRYVGFSAHTEEAALLAMDRYDFDSVLFPINFACLLATGFGRRVLEQATARGVTVLALKALARQRWPEAHPLRDTYGKCWYQPVVEPGLSDLAIRFTLSQPVTAAVSPGHRDLLERAVACARGFQPLSDTELEQLRTEAEGLTAIFATCEGTAQ